MSETCASQCTRKHVDRFDKYWCSTNSGHEHSSSWEAENCSRLHEALREVLHDLECYKAVDYDVLYDDVHDAERR
jgi:hypothetical protein